MDMLDVFALTGLQWVYDEVEKRYGRAAAMLVTIGLAIAALATLITVAVMII